MNFITEPVPCPEKQEQWTGFADKMLQISEGYLSGHNPCGCRNYYRPHAFLTCNL